MVTADPVGTVGTMTRTVGGHRVYVLPLGYDKPPLTLNTSGSWRAKHNKIKQLRVTVAWRLREVAGGPPGRVPHIHVTLHYVPKDRRARDSDNLVATLKPCIDALTAAGQARGWPCTPLVADDTPEHVSWSPPRIHLPDEHGPRLWLEVVTGSGA